MKWNLIQFRIIWKENKQVGFCDLLSLGIIYDHEITQYMCDVMLLCLWKIFCNKPVFGEIYGI